ncbi:hypothetical protein LEMLEM_LOCUS2629 [Lemmus lemmus]
MNLALWTRLVSNSQKSACLCSPSAGIKASLKREGLHQSPGANFRPRQLRHRGA